MIAEQEQVRVDKWLWAARFFKTRGLASKAVSGGKIFLNGQRCKPSKAVALNDILIIHKGEVEQTVAILGLSNKRGPATVARTLYQETEESVKKEKNSGSYAPSFMQGRLRLLNVRESGIVVKSEILFVKTTNTNH